MNLKRLSEFVLLGVVVTSTLLFGQDAETILAGIDSVMQAPSDMTAVEKMTLIDSEGAAKERTVKVYTKGSEKRLIRFLSPADVKGVGFLRLAADRLYLYLPAFRKVRRIASSVKNENFMGTDFSYEDIAQTGYHQDYIAKEIQQQQGQYVLQLAPRQGADVSYGKLVLYADMNNLVVRKVESFDPNGRPLKIMTTDNVAQINGYWTPRRMEMTTLKNGHRTVLELSEIQFDQGLAQDVFSQRNLKRAR